MTQQIAWTQRTFNFDFSVEMFPVIFSRLEGSIFRLQRILMNADEDDCSCDKQGWSVKNHLGHLYDLEELWWKRLKDFNENKAVLTAADMSNEKTNTADHNIKSLEHLLALFAAERQKILEAVFSFDKHELERTALHGRLQKPMRMIDLLFFVAEHDDHHIATISSLLRNEKP